ncbi:hypothetical protein R1sor_009963 [Riccia sorocarpa]|uniref:glutathione transferase n=1 Tax=Riccia sorocarpa TaxID=122646 RepID=A0ABD3HZC6_9MARC
MAVKIYGNPVSPPTRNVIASLYEKGVEFELVVLDLLAGAHKKPEHLKLQPFGKIPVYQDGDITLFESRAITRYIATKYEGQGTPLYGKTPTEKALVEQWVEVESQNYSPVTSALNFQLFIKKLFTGEGPDEAAVAVEVPKLNAVLDIYEARLTESKYLAGDFFSLADLSHFANTEYFVKHSGKADLITSRPHVAAWWQDISSRPSWQKTIAYCSF